MSSLTEDTSSSADGSGGGDAIGRFALGGINSDDLDDSRGTDMADDDGGGGGDDALELVHVNQDFFYMEHVMRLAAMLHSLVSLAMLIAYYHLKVPLAIFKREKEIARQLEFDGLYIVEQPEDDDIKSHWDKLVISAKYVASREFFRSNCSPGFRSSKTRALNYCAPRSIACERAICFYESRRTRTRRVLKSFLIQRF